MQKLVEIRVSDEVQEGLRRRVKLAHPRNEVAPFEAT